MSVYRFIACDFHLSINSERHDCQQRITCYNDGDLVKAGWLRLISIKTNNYMDLQRYYNDNNLDDILVHLCPEHAKVVWR